MNHTTTVQAGVRYWEDASVNGVKDRDGKLIPCRSGYCWSPTIIAKTGQIENWDIGKSAKVHYKICDSGQYYYDDGLSNYKCKDDYVPSFLCPDASGYGDYIIMTIDENGFIKDWDFEFDDEEWEILD